MKFNEGNWFLFIKVIWQWIKTCSWVWISPRGQRLSSLGVLLHLPISIFNLCETNLGLLKAIMAKSGIWVLLYTVQIELQIKHLYLKWLDLQQSTLATTDWDLTQLKTNIMYIRTTEACMHSIVCKELFSTHNTLCRYIYNVSLVLVFHVQMILITLLLMSY